MQKKQSSVATGAANRIAKDQPPDDEFGDLVDMFATSLRAARRSDRTIKSYLQALNLLHAFTRERGMPTDPLNMRREHIESFFADLAGRTAKHTGKPQTDNTILNRYRSLHAFFEWLVKVDEIPRSPMEKMTMPRKRKSPPPVMTEEQLADLFDACKGKEYEDRRDRAVLMLLLDTGLRREEIAHIGLDDINWDHQTIKVIGKGNKPRTVPFGDQTSLALRAYIRARRQHAYTERLELWLGRQGPLTSEGIYQIVKKRSARAGIGKVWVHLFRHTWAHQFKVSGGEFEDLKTLGGWDSNEVPMWYGSSEAQSRAMKTGRERSAADRLLGDKRKKK